MALNNQADIPPETYANFLKTCLYLPEPLKSNCLNNPIIKQILRKRASLIPSDEIIFELSKTVSIEEMNEARDLLKVAAEWVTNIAKI